MLLYYIIGELMLRRYIATGIVLLFLLSSTLPLVTSDSSNNADFLDIDNSIHENYCEEVHNENETIVATMGSLLFSDIELLDGDSSEIQQIERILNSIILQLITPYIDINVTDLEITVSYEKKIPSILTRRYTYFTGLFDGENTKIYNGTHRVHIKGLDGQFFYLGGFPFLFMPRSFILLGTYEEIVVENIGDESAVRY